MEIRGLLHLISRRHLIRFGMPDWSTSEKLMVLLAPYQVSLNLFCRNGHWKLFLMVSLHLFISPIMEFLRNHFYGQTDSWFLWMIFQMRFYANDTTLYSSLSKSGIFEVESSDELELDLHSIVEWGDRWLVTYNATKQHCFLSITIEILFWCLWRWMALSCQKRLVFVCLAWPRLIYGLEGCFKESGPPW